MTLLSRKIVRRVRPQYRRDYKHLKILCHRTAKLVHEERIEFGRYVYIGPRCFINGEGGLEIGDGTIFGPEVVLLTANHDWRMGQSLPFDVYDEHRSVRIGRGVGIGYRAMLCPGITIGDGAGVGMGAVVMRDVLDGQLVLGNPSVRVRVASRAAGVARERIDREAYFLKEYWANF